RRGAGAARALGRDPEGRDRALQRARRAVAEPTEVPLEGGNIPGPVAVSSPVGMISLLMKVVLSANTRVHTNIGAPIMLVLHRRQITAAAVAAGLLAMLPAAASAQAATDDKALAAALKAGGNVILVRHGATFADQADTDPFNFDNIAKQRNL